MMFTAYEMLVVLRIYMSASDIEEAGGPCVRNQQRILANPTRPAANSSIVQLMRLLVERQLLPISDFWVAPLMSLYEHEKKREHGAIEREYKALFEMARLVAEANLASVPSEARVGALLFAAKYASSFATARDGKHAKLRSSAYDTSSPYYGALIAALKSDPRPCALRLKN